MTGAEFETYCGRILSAYYADNLVVVSAEYGGDYGCDFLIKDEYTVIQIYAPQESMYIGKVFIQRVKDKLHTDLKKTTQYQEEIEDMLGGPIQKWKLIIPEDPVPDILKYATKQEESYAFPVLVQGKTHLEEMKRNIGYDPNEKNWLDLRNIMGTFEDYDLFDEHGTLKDIFVEPDAFITIPDLSSKLSHTRRQPILQFLEAYVLNLEKEYHSKKPLIVFGEYGVGKSSCLRMLASRLANNKKSPIPIYIPLREAVITSSSNMIDSIKNYLETNHLIDSFDSDIRRRPVCWLLDGFDELNLYESKNEQWIIERFREIERLAQIRKSIVIVASRPILFLGDILNIPTESIRLTIEPFDIKKIGRWINNWKGLSAHRKNSISIDGLKSRNLLSEATNPLVLFMIASLFDEELKENKPYLRAEIFKIFIDSTEKGKFNRESGYENYHKIPENYREILQEIAYVIFRYGNSGLISKTELINKLPEGRAAIDLLNAHQLRSILVSHFFKEAEIKDKEPYVEFSHQSFREYLVVEKFMNMIVDATEEKFNMRDWHEFSLKMLTSAKLQFLRESLCMLDSETRIKIFNLFVYFTLTQRGIEKHFVPDQIAEDTIEILKSIDFTSNMRNILAYFICSTIAAYGSDSLRSKLVMPTMKNGLIDIYHNANSYQPTSSIEKAYNLLLNELPGGILGPDFTWRGFEIEVKHISDYAIITPRTNNIIITCNSISFLLFVLKEYQLLILGSSQINHSVFYGGQLIINNIETTFENCTFINCKIVVTRSDSTIIMKKSKFISSTIIGEKTTLDYHDVIQNNDKIYIDIVDNAVRHLKEYVENYGCSPFVPWTDVIACRIPEFAEMIFQDEQHALRFNSVCREVAISSE